MGNESSVLNVTWMSPSGGDEIRNYTIRWFDQNGLVSDDTEHHVSHQSLFMTRLSNLSAGIDYRIEVKAVNEAGSGALSNISHCTSM